jgi:ribosomal protein S18 acetylase RimI-like enzyme
MTIRDTSAEDAEAITFLVDAVARERRYLASTAGFSLASTTAFLASIRAANGVHVVAVADDGIVGWCDITPHHYEGMKHVGVLGMGVKGGCRGRGIGTRLLRAALGRAFSNGLERVELEVFRSNTAAVRLYETNGFIPEGARSRARKLDGVVDDVLLFAAFKPA